MTAACTAAAVLIIAAIYATYRAASWEPRGGRHARLFADPRDVTDPDGTQFLLELHHELSPFPAPGRLEMLPPDPPPADTTPLPVVTCELGMTISEYIDMLFAKYGEVTS